MDGVGDIEDSLLVSLYILRSSDAITPPPPQKRGFLAQIYTQSMGNAKKWIFTEEALYYNRLYYLDINGT